MAKDPAFLFYANDWIGGTMGMTLEEKGAYIELLILQFNRGHMTSHMIGQILGQNHGQLWDTLKDKFIQDENGLFFNKRLDEEKTKRQKYSESRRNNIKGVNQYTNKNQKSNKKINGHMTSHMENENENEYVNRNVNKKGGVGEKINFSDLENTQWFESILRVFAGRISIEELRDYWKQFQLAMIADDDLYRDAKDYRAHFRNWVKIQVEKQNDQQTGLVKRFKVFTDED